MNDWLPVKRKEVSEAYIPDVGDQIATLNGVVIANPDTIVIRHRNTDSDYWDVFVTDTDMFNTNYEWFEDGEKESESVESEVSEFEGENSESNGETPSEGETLEAALDEQSDREILEDKYWDMLKPDLIEACKNKNLDHSGNKEDLVKRLVANELNND